MGLCYRFGYGVEKNETLVFQYLFEANQHIDDNKTRFELAKCYYYGIDTNEDKGASFEHFNQLVLNQYKYVYNYLGLCYLNGYGVEINLYKALNYYQQSSNLGKKHKKIRKL